MNALSQTVPSSHISVSHIAIMHHLSSVQTTYVHGLCSLAICPGFLEQQSPSNCTKANVYYCLVIEN